MNWQRHQIILLVLKCLRENGSWAGKTHVIKTLFLLSALSGEQIPFKFVLYKHGPYSFDIEDELAIMKSYSAIGSDSMISGYGERLIPGNNSEILEKNAGAKVNKKFQDEIQKICRLVGAKNVKQLECLATVAWIVKTENKKDQQSVLDRLKFLKPHIASEEGLTAYKEIMAFQPAH